MDSCPRTQACPQAQACDVGDAYAPPISKLLVSARAAASDQEAASETVTEEDSEWGSDISAALQARLEPPAGRGHESLPPLPLGKIIVAQEAICQKLLEQDRRMRAILGGGGAPPPVGGLGEGDSVAPRDADEAGSPWTGPATAESSSAASPRRQSSKASAQGPPSPDPEAAEAAARVAGIFAQGSRALGWTPPPAPEDSSSAFLQLAALVAAARTQEEGHATPAWHAEGVEDGRAAPASAWPAEGEEGCDAAIPAEGQESPSRLSLAAGSRPCAAGAAACGEPATTPRAAAMAAAFAEATSTTAVLRMVGTIPALPFDAGAQCAAEEPAFAQGAAAQPTSLSRPAAAEQPAAGSSPGLGLLDAEGAAAIAPQCASRHGSGSDARRPRSPRGVGLVELAGRAGQRIRV